MRYKDTTNEELIIPPEQLANHASDDMLMLTGIIGFVIGVIFIIGGRLGKQMWIWVWGVGLLFASAYLWSSLYFDVTLFGAF